MNEKSKANKLDFNQMISQNFKDLTKSEKRIANFFRKNQDESSFLSAAEVAQRLDLSEATIVRFARTIGYPSYPALRSQMQDHFRQRITHSTRLRSRLNDIRESGDIFERLAATEIDYLSQALGMVNRTALQQAASQIKDHQRIFVFGLGPSISLVNLLEIRLRRFGKDVVPLTNSGRELLESLLCLKADDLIFVICFFDQNPALQLTLDYARNTGCTIIMLTDTLESILGDAADVVISAQRGPVGEFHSLVVPMTIINAILLTIASEEQDTIIPILDKLDSLRDQLKLLNTQDG
jgi:DNA-binding MurR/RpiR family transcriptional regulator